MKNSQLLLCFAFQVAFVRPSLANAISYDNYAVLDGVAFSNTTNTSSVVKTDSLTLCSVRCSAENCNAAQYSNMDGMCSMTFGCALNALNTDNSQLYTVISKGYVVSGLPLPMLEWMMTDACGSANTGWFNPGLLMQQQSGGTNTWTATYNISVGQMFGNAIWYPNIIKYGSVSDRFTLTLDFSKSLTLFAYYWLYAIPQKFCLVEFDAGTNFASADYLPHFWYDFGGLLTNFNFAGCTGDCQGIRYKYALQTNAWTYAALVYNSTSKLFTAYLNESKVWQSTNPTTFNSTLTVNYIVTGTRKNYGQLPGTTFCVKVFQAALSANSIKDVANSCKLPTLSEVPNFPVAIL